VIDVSGIVEGALVDGSVYALVGVGFVTLYRATKVLNFAQGSLMALAAFIFRYIAVDLGLGLAAGLILGVCIMAVIGGALFWLIFRRLADAPPFVTIIATLGLGVIVETIYYLIWGTQVLSVPNYFGTSKVRIGITFPVTDLFVIGEAVVVVAALELFLHRSTIGVRMRGIADNPRLASFVGVNVHWVSAIAWAVSCACAAVAGIALALRSDVDPVSIQGVGYLAFPAIVLGGLDSFRGVLAGSLLLALIGSVIGTVINGQWVEIGSYSILIVIVLFRPTGLFGSRDAARV
jgi:branched-chain amino acid transport system permease protein